MFIKNISSFLFSELGKVKILHSTEVACLLELHIIRAAVCPFYAARSLVRIFPVV